MAKSGVYEGGDEAMVVNAVVLKKELQKLLKAIVDEDDVNLEAVDRAQQMLVVLKELKLKKSADLYLQSHQEKLPATVPDNFKCPLSKKLMRDPVILASGLTYDRPYIERWLKSGKRTCPKTDQVLAHTTLTPNQLILEMITNWCNNHGFKLPECKYNDEDALNEADRDQFLQLLEKMSATLPEQKEAARELRLLTKRIPSFRALFSESTDVILQLVAPISPIMSGTEVDQDLLEDIITTILNISIHDNNKQHVAKAPNVIPILITAVRSGTIQIRSNAAAALFTLCALDSNKDFIGEQGALRPLIELLDEGQLPATKDAATAIFSMCMTHENKRRAVRDGAVGAILRKIRDRIQVDEMLPMLAMLSNNRQAREQMMELAAAPCLLSIMRETSCPRNKENCIAILHALCCNYQQMWKEMKEEEKQHHTISRLAQHGTSRAQRKASGILDKLNRANNIIHSA